MSSGTLAARYARALFDAAEEHHITADVAEQVNMLREQLTGVAGYNQLISGRAIDAPHKKKLIDEVYGSQLHPFVRNFLFILLDKNREGMIEEALDAFDGLYRKKLGVVTARLTTSKPIPQEDIDKLADSLKKLFKNDIVFQQNVDPSIIGGAVISVGDLLIDGSLKSNLRHMRDELMK